MLQLESRTQTTVTEISLPESTDQRTPTRWTWPIVGIFLLNLLGLPYLFAREDMLKGGQNWDTRLFYNLIPQEKHPLSWFWSDWPLKNGFYRPIPAFSFFFDIHLFGAHFMLYRLQEFGAAVLTGVAVMWLVWELTRQRTWAIGAAALFAIQQSDSGRNLHLSVLLPIVVAGFGIYGVRRRLISWKSTVVLVLASVMLGFEIAQPPGLGDLWHGSYGYRNMGWPPGRTSVFMSLFAVVCLASFHRWLRRGEGKWLALTTATFVLSFLCYEQAMTLPILLTATVLLICPEQWKKAALPCMAAALATAMYWKWHVRVIPMNTQYQIIHRRADSLALMDFMDYLVRGISDVFSLRAHYAGHVPDPRGLPIATAMGVFAIVCSLAGFYAMRRDFKWAFVGLSLSAIAFSPLAFAQPLFHYAYFSACLRSMFLVALLFAVGERLGPTIDEIKAEWRLHRLVAP